VRPGVDEVLTVLKAIRAAVDVVLPTGFAVLNRDDPEAAAMAEHCPGQVVLFGREDWSRWSESPAPEGVEPLLAAAATALALGVSAPRIREYLNNFAG
jgi:UDP-N-acetylmuramyl tripeptide synthase